MIEEGEHLATLFVGERPVEKIQVRARIEHERHERPQPRRIRGQVRVSQGRLAQGRQGRSVQALDCDGDRPLQRGLPQDRPQTQQFGQDRRQVAGAGGEGVQLRHIGGPGA